MPLLSTLRKGMVLAGAVALLGAGVPVLGAGTGTTSAATTATTTTTPAATSAPASTGNQANWVPSAAGINGYSSTPVWSDEFNGAALDTNTWFAENKAWTDNGELEYYSHDPKYVNTANGNLVITAAKESTGDRDYTSGRISTALSTTFRQGVYAARMKVPKGQGIWPAFWMFGTGAMYSEIDIMELAGGTAGSGKGSGDDTAYGSLTHFATQDGGPVTQGPGASHHAPSGQKFADDWHVYWLEWDVSGALYAGYDTSDRQKVVDDIHQLKAFDNNMYLIFNVAVGGNFPGNPDSTTVFPQQLEVDWVRVYAPQDGTQVVYKAVLDDDGNPAGGNPGSQGAAVAEDAAVGAAPLSVFGLVASAAAAWALAARKLF